MGKLSVMPYRHQADSKGSGIGWQSPSSFSGPAAGYSLAVCSPIHFLSSLALELPISFALLGQANLWQVQNYFRLVLALQSMEVRDPSTSSCEQAVRPSPTRILPHFTQDPLPVSSEHSDWPHKDGQNPNTPKTYYKKLFFSLIFS